MKISQKKLYTFALTAVLVFGIYSQIPQKQVAAQACAAGQTAGNLYGYLETDEMGFIYLSTESWNDDLAGEGHEPTSLTFSASYDRQTNRFNGRGWSPYAGWVDFGEINTSNSANQIAEFESMKNNPGDWGNVTPEINLSSVNYQTDPGGFNGSAFHGNETSPGDNGNLYGAGNIDFSNVSIIQPACTQYVSLTLNGASDIYRSSCPVSGTIQINWASENVADCFVDSNNWSAANNSSLPDEYQNGNNYTFTGNVNDSSPQDTVKIRCLGSNGQTVTDSATVSCGSTVTPPAGTDGFVIPTYQEV